MSLAVLFSISAQEVFKLRAQRDDDARLEYIQSELEPRYFAEEPDRMCGLDKSWDAMHRALTKGTLESPDASYPLSHVILGGESVYGAEDYIMMLKTPAQVSDIAAAIQGIDESAFRSRYNRIDPADYSEHDEDDLEYTWECFDESKAFWQLAAEENRHVLFTADQ